MKKIFPVAAFLLMLLGTLGSCKKERQLFDPVKQLELDEQQIKKYIADSIPAKRHDSGIYYVIHEPGTGNVTYDENTTITAKYSIRIMNGPVIPQESSTITTKMEGIIGGWWYGVPLIQEGGKIRLLVPSGWAYGPYGRDDIPPNSILDFTIELLDVTHE